MRENNYLAKRNCLRGILALLMLFPALGIPECGVVEFADYSFDLTAGIKNEAIQSSIQGTYVNIAPCSPMPNCSGVNTYMKQSSSQNQCTPFTSMPSFTLTLVGQMIRQNYAYINPSNPETGLQINYLPFIEIVKTNKTITNTDPTAADVVINITTTTTYYGSLNVYCNSVAGTNICNLTSTNSNTSTMQGIIITIQSNASCAVYTSLGCPYLTVNQFWHFLIANALWFGILLWIVALFELFMGYFVIRMTILIHGIMTGGVFSIVFSAINYQDFQFDNDAYAISVFIVLISVLMGILFGLALLTLPKIGYMNIGMWVAIIFSLLLQNSALYATGSMLGFYITLGVSGLLMLVLSLLALRNFIIISSAFTSAFWIVRPLGFFLPYYPNEFQAEKLFTINSSTPWQFYLYLIAILVITVLGSAFQFCLYKKKGRDQGNKGYYLEEEGTFK